MHICAFELQYCVFLSFSLSLSPFAIVSSLSSLFRFHYCPILYLQSARMRFRCTELCLRICAKLEPLHTRVEKCVQ